MGTKDKMQDQSKQWQQQAKQKAQQAKEQMPQRGRRRDTDEETERLRREEEDRLNQDYDA
ncbi:hypothetical protein [Streptomyces sp. NPDC096132]|uniref:hypothetical protein n=1 Tax=Streptomyces sp. NPDC096132 TaxID=3366075 RepID=UPI0038223A90